MVLVSRGCRARPARSTRRESRIENRHAKAMSFKVSRRFSIFAARRRNLERSRETKKEEPKNQIFLHAAEAAREIGSARDLPLIRTPAKRYRIFAPFCGSGKKGGKIGADKKKEKKKNRETGEKRRGQQQRV